MSITKNKPKYQNKVWLEDQYIKQKKFCKDIAKEQGVHTSTINVWLNIHSIFKYGNGFLDHLKKIRNF